MDGLTVVSRVQNVIVEREKVTVGEKGVSKQPEPPLLKPSSDSGGHGLVRGGARVVLCSSKSVRLERQQHVYVLTA
jgi:hypothetical protein